MLKELVMYKEWKRCRGCLKYAGALLHGSVVTDREQPGPEFELRGPLFLLVDQPLGKGIFRLERIRTSIRCDLYMGVCVSRGNKLDTGQ